MSPAVRSVPVESNGRDDIGEPPDDVDARGVAMALIALRGDLGKRYGILATHVQDLHDVTKTLTDAAAVLSSSINRLSVRLDKSEEHDGRILAALARIEARESQHRTELKSITDEVTEVKAAHGGWLAVGSFMDRHRKLASTVAFLVLLGFQIFHLLKK